jgi:hypothetical protein
MAHCMVNIASARSYPNTYRARTPKNRSDAYQISVADPLMSRVLRSLTVQCMERIRKRFGKGLMTLR